jgi:hypothetical protein
MDLVSCSPFIRVGGAFVVVLPLQLFDKRIACLVLSLRWYSFGQRSCHTQRFCTSSRHGHVEAGSNSLPGWATEKVELSPNGNVVAGMWSRLARFVSTSVLVPTYLTFRLLTMERAVKSRSQPTLSVL